MPFKAVLLDLDNTLYDYDTAHKPALAAAISFFSDAFSLSNDTVSGAYREGRSQINRELAGQGASHSRLLYFQRVSELLGFDPCLHSLEAERVYWERFISKMELRPGAIDFLDSIRDLQVAIVTDLTAQIQFQKLQHFRFQNRFQAIVTSEEAGIEKPDARIFKLALHKLGCDATDACVVGDNWHKDISGGVSLGMRSFWMRLDQEPPAERHELSVEFESFSQLKTLIRSF
jgi:putative hydrolase of the HAD superfamily